MLFSTLPPFFAVAPAAAALIEAAVVSESLASLVGASATTVLALVTV